MFMGRPSRDTGAGTSALSQSWLRECLHKAWSGSVPCPGVEGYVVHRVSFQQLKFSQCYRSVCIQTASL